MAINTTDFTKAAGGFVVFFDTEDAIAGETVFSFDGSKGALFIRRCGMACATAARGTLGCGSAGAAARFLGRLPPVSGGPSYAYADFGHDGIKLTDVTRVWLDATLAGGICGFIDGYLGPK